MNPDGPGLRCRNCQSRTDVIDSRCSGVAIRRRRRCRGCKAKVTTFELILAPSHREAVLKFAAALALHDHLTGRPSPAGQLSLDAALVGCDAEDAPFP